MTASDLHQRLLHQLDRVKALNTPLSYASARGRPPQPHPSPRADTNAEAPHIPALINQAGIALRSATGNHQDRSDQHPETTGKGLIIYPGHEPGVACEISELTSTGAKLHLGDDFTVPSCFELNILPENISKKAQICRRGDRELGVRFIDND